MSKIAFQGDFLGELEDEDDIDDWGQVVEVGGWIDSFFSGVPVDGDVSPLPRLNWHVGGPIPKHLMHNKRNYNLVNNIPLVSAIDIGYASIERGEREDRPLLRMADDETAALSVLQIHLKRLGVL